MIVEWLLIGDCLFSIEDQTAQGMTMRRPTFPRTAHLLVTFALVTLAVPSLAQQDRTALPAAACANLLNLSIPASAIGLPTSGAVVQTAVAVAASEQGNANGDFCKVTGIVKPQNPSSPNLEFEVNLPPAWNRRALQMGGGGYNGTLVTGLDRLHAAAGERGQPAEAGLRHARHRRRPQVHGRIRRLASRWMTRRCATSARSR